MVRGMAQQNRDYSAVVAESAAAIIDRVNDRLAEVTRLTQQVLVRDISELPGDAQLQQLLRDNVAANIDTTFSAIRNNIPIAGVAVVLQCSLVVWTEKSLTSTSNSWSITSGSVSSMTVCSRISWA